MAEAIAAGAGTRIAMRVAMPLGKYGLKKLLPKKSRDRLSELAQSVLGSKTSEIVKRDQLKPWKMSLEHYSAALDILGTMPDFEDNFSEDELATVILLKARSSLNPDMFNRLEEKLKKAEYASLAAFTAEVELTHHLDYPLIEVFDVWQFCSAARCILTMKEELADDYIKLIIEAWGRRVKELYGFPLVQQCLRNKLDPTFSQKHMNVDDKKGAYNYLLEVLNVMVEIARFFATLTKDDNLKVSLKTFVKEIDTPPGDIENLKNCQKFLGTDLKKMFNDLEAFDWSTVETDQSPITPGIETKPPPEMVTCSTETTHEIATIPQPSMTNRLIDWWRTRKVAAEIRNAYKAQFRTINPLPFEPEEWKIDDYWINLELKNPKQHLADDGHQNTVDDRPNPSYLAQLNAATIARISILMGALAIAASWAANLCLDETWLAYVPFVLLTICAGSWASNYFWVQMSPCLAQVSTAFSNANVAICKGDPGCGKSTLCYYLCYKWAIGEWGKEIDIVIFARLRDLEQTESILELGANWMAKFGFCRDKDNLLKAAEEAKTLIILDGYDESLWTDKEGKVRGICSELENLLESTSFYLPFNLLLTSCSWAVDNDRIKYRGKAQILTILPLMPYQQEEYAGKIIQDKQKVNMLMKTIRKSRDKDSSIDDDWSRNDYSFEDGASSVTLSESSSDDDDDDDDESLHMLTRSILTFSYICFFCKTEKSDDFELPFKTVDQLYSHLFARLVDRHDEKEMNKAEWNWETLPQIRQLGKMAMAGMGGKEYGNPQLSFTIDDLHEFKIDEGYCTGAGLLIKNCYKNTGSSSVVYYSFAHRTAQQYLAWKFMFDIYKEIAKTHSVDDNVFGELHAAGSHPDMRDVVDRLEGFIDFEIEKVNDLVRMATEDHENILPVALVLMDTDILTHYVFSPIPLFSTLCDLLDSQSGQSPSRIPISRARDAFKRFIKKKISKEFELSAIDSDEAIVDLLYLCHKFDFPFRRVFDNNGNTEHQSIALLYFPTWKTLFYVKSSVLERFKHPIDTINVTDRDLSVIDHMGIHTDVTEEDLLRSPRLPISHIERIRTKYSPYLQFSRTPPFSQSHPSAENNGETGAITVSVVQTGENLLPALQYFQSLHPPPLISSIGMHLYDLREYSRNPHDWESVSSLLLNYDKMKLRHILFSLDVERSFPMAVFIEFPSLFKNLRHVRFVTVADSLTGCDLDDDVPISEKNLKIFLDWLHPLLVDPHVSVEYDHDSRLGGTIDQYLSSVSNASKSVPA